jgi:hypothetical protein
VATVDSLGNQSASTYARASEDIVWGYFVEGHYADVVNAVKSYKPDECREASFGACNFRAKWAKRWLYCTGGENRARKTGAKPQVRSGRSVAGEKYFPASLGKAVPRLRLEESGRPATLP